jgi:hypothetical protein
MVGMPVSDVNRGQPPTGSGDPVGEVRRLRIGQKRVDQQGVLLTVDQRGRVGDPLQLILAGRDALRCACAFFDEEFPLKGLGH